MLCYAVRKLGQDESPPFLPSFTVVYAIAVTSSTLTCDCLLRHMLRSHVAFTRRMWEWRPTIAPYEGQ